jgi:hypothetical protein
MDQDQADFFKTNVLPIIREAGKNQETNTEQVNPLRPMLRMLLLYIEFLDSRDIKKPQGQA